MYDGTLDDESPVHGSAVSFKIGDFLHIFEKFDGNWWVGRKVKENCDIGFIPSPDRLEQLILQKAPVGKLDRVKGGDGVPPTQAAAQATSPPAPTDVAPGENNFQPHWHLMRTTSTTDVEFVTKVTSLALSMRSGKILKNQRKRLTFLCNLPFSGWRCCSISQNDWS